MPTIYRYTTDPSRGGMFYAVDANGNPAEPPRLGPPRDDAIFLLYTPGFNITANGDGCLDCNFRIGESFHDTYIHHCGAEVCRENYAVCPSCSDCVGLCCRVEDYGEEEDDGSCFSEPEPERDRRIYYYSYKPAPVWFGGPSAPYYLGAELEITAPYRASAEPVYDWADSEGFNDFFYCKEDGSVEGFEIVTHPFTPEFAQRFPWDSFFDMLNDEYPIRGDEPRSHGLHVHISRTAFPTTSALARFSHLLNRNIAQVSAIARRHNTDYTQFSRTPVSEVAMSVTEWIERASAEGRRRTVWDEALGEYVYRDAPRTHPWTAYGMSTLTGRAVLDYVEGHTYPQRYRAVNLTNDETVEIRAFRSTRSPEEMWSALSLLIDAVSYSTDMQLHTSVPVSERMTWDAFDTFRKSKVQSERL